ncbi:hypothetical protein ACSBR1_038627 [Camellia fascicularis]
MYTSTGQIPTITTTVMAAEEPPPPRNMYRVLLDRFQSLEASHTRLRQQFDVLVEEKRLNEHGSSDSGDTTSYYGWGPLRGVFSCGGPHRNVLECIGHAVHVSRVVSGDIIFWNRSAEKLYGYKDYEVIGKRVLEVLIDDKHYFSSKKIIDRLSCGQSWSGQFPFKKKSGEIFMAIVTESPLYEEGELVGVITVSSDAAAFNNLNSDHANGPPRLCGFNLKKIQWQTQPQIASSVSNLASKVLPRKRADNTSNACTVSKSKEVSVLDDEDVKFEKPPKIPTGKPSFNLHVGKGTTDGGSSQKDESTFQFTQPTKIATKLLSKLNIGGIGSHGKEKDENIQQYCPTDTPISNKVVTQPNPPRDLKATTSYHCTVYAEFEAENPHKRNSPCAAKRENSYVNGHKILNSFEEDYSIKSFSRECNDYSEIIKARDHLARLDFHCDVKELEPESQNSKSLEIENAVQQQPDPQQHSSSAGSIGSNHGSLSGKGNNESNLVLDYEIHWDDLQLREEIGQGSFASVYHGIWNGSDVAVKVYFGNEYGEGTLLDYKKEIDIMRRLRHPNVLLFMGAVYSGEKEKLAIVSEFLPRGSLFKTLHKNNQSLDIRRRLRMALDVARGMNYLHHRNPPIVHRDLKSSNLLVDKNWTVKVGDFGLSKLKHATFLTAKSGRGTVKIIPFIQIDFAKNIYIYKMNKIIMIITVDAYY